MADAKPGSAGLVLFYPLYRPISPRKYGHAPRFNGGSVYRMEWSAPTDRRAVEIKSIEFVGNGSTVPVLLGITGVTEW